MITNFKNNPEYKEIYKIKKVENKNGIDYVKNISFYVPIDTTKYHLSRVVAANAQNIYAANGITKDLQSELIEQIILKCNNRKDTLDKVLTDISLIANNLKYRMKYPVDEECLLRMSAIYTFIDNEDPNKLSNAFTQKKVDMAKEDAGLYDFFISMGLKLTPAYQDYQNILEDLDYFQKRKTITDSMTLHPSLSK